MMKSTKLTSLASLVLVAIIAVGGLGCSTVNQPGSTDSASQSFSDFIQRIQDVTVTDLDAAIADVHSHGDVDLAALQCYPSVKDFIQSSPIKPQTPNIKGVFSANQVKRDVLLGGLNNDAFKMALRKLHTACAAYIGDETRFAAELAALIGSRGAIKLPSLP